MKLTIKTSAFLLVALTLTGCGREDWASHYIDGSSYHSFSLLRDKPVFWSSGWDTSLVVTRKPECLRRHKMGHVPDENFKVELYRTPDGGAYILRQGDEWFVAETRQCQMQKFKTPPPEPGDLLGAFVEVDDKLQFVPVGKPAAPTR